MERLIGLVPWWPPRARARSRARSVVELSLCRLHLKLPSRLRLLKPAVIGIAEQPEPAQASPVLLQLRHRLGWARARHLDFVDADVASLTDTTTKYYLLTYLDFLIFTTHTLPPCAQLARPPFPLPLSTAKNGVSLTL